MTTLSGRQAQALLTELTPDPAQVAVTLATGSSWSEFESALLVVKPGVVGRKVLGALRKPEGGEGGVADDLKTVPRLLPRGISSVRGGGRPRLGHKSRTTRCVQLATSTGTPTC